MTLVRYWPPNLWAESTWAEACAGLGSTVLERVEPPHFTPTATDRFELELPGWMKDALCVEPEYAAMPWTNSPSGASFIAQRMCDVCDRCLVRDECLEDALATETSEAVGIRGGLNAKTRIALFKTRHKAATPSRPEFVYFARRASDGAIKIGWSHDPTARTKTLGAELLNSIPGSRRLEQDLHARFDADRLDGEWFRPSADLLDFMGDLRQERAA